MTTSILIHLNIFGVVKLLAFDDNWFGCIIVIRHSIQKHQYCNNYQGYHYANSCRTISQWTKHCFICTVRINCILPYQYPSASLANLLFLFQIPSLLYIYLYSIHNIVSFLPLCIQIFTSWNLVTITKNFLSESSKLCKDLYFVHLWREL